MNKHMEYKSPIYSGSKDMIKVNIFEKWVKLKGKGHKVYFNKCNAKCGIPLQGGDLTLTFDLMTETDLET